MGEEGRCDEVEPTAGGKVCRMQQSGSGQGRSEALAAEGWLALFSDSETGSMYCWLLSLAKETPLNESLRYMHLVEGRWHDT